MAESSSKESFCLDDREILSICWLINDNFIEKIELGKDGVNKIDCKEQFLGEYSICWLQVWKSDELVARYNARNIDSIEYAEDNYE